MTCRIGGSQNKIFGDDNILNTNRTKLLHGEGRNRIGRRDKWPKKSREEGEIGGKSREEGENVR